MFIGKNEMTHEKVRCAEYSLFYGGTCVRVVALNEWIKRGFNHGIDVVDISNLLKEDHGIGLFFFFWYHTIAQNISLPSS